MKKRLTINTFCKTVLLLISLVFFTKQGFGIDIESCFHVDRVLRGQSQPMIKKIFGEPDHQRFLNMFGRTSVLWDYESKIQNLKFAKKGCLLIRVCFSEEGVVTQVVHRHSPKGFRRYFINKSKNNIMGILGKPDRVRSWRGDDTGYWTYKLIPNVKVNLIIYDKFVDKYVEAVDIEFVNNRAKKIIFQFE